MRHSIGLDIGGSSIKSALINDKGHVLHTYELPTHEKEQNISEVLFSLVDAELQYASKNHLKVHDVGIGAPGLIDRKLGVLVKAANLNIENFPIVDKISNKYGLNVFLDADVTVAAIGEWRFGSAKDKDTIIFLSAGTGVGAGLILDGRPYVGAHGIAGNVGHLKIKQQDLDECDNILLNMPCGCGSKGCIEGALGWRGLVDMALRRMDRYPDSVLCTNYRNIQEDAVINTVHIWKAAANGDKLAVNVVNDFCHMVGCLVGELISTYDPEAVILGGGVFNEGEHFLDLIKAGALKGGIPQLVQKVSIEFSSLGRIAGAVGAGALAFLPENLGAKLAHTGA